MATTVTPAATDPLPPNPVLREMLRENAVTLADGRIKRLSAATSADECAAMYRVLRERQPSQAIEIGMGYGVSTLTILTALADNERGSLISIDPYVGWESGRQAALAAVRRCGLEHRHTHLHGPSELELPRLIRDGFEADFVYIDGCHDFENVLIDMFYSDRLLAPGGLLALDDTGWRSVHRVVRHLLRTRPYREIDVGLKRSYRGRNPLFTAARLLQGRFGTSRYFEKQRA